MYTVIGHIVYTVIGHTVYTVKGQSQSNVMNLLVNVISVNIVAVI